MTDSPDRPQAPTLIEQARKSLMSAFSGYIAGASTFTDLENRIEELIEVAQESQRQALLTLQQEKDLGASMLARQCDLAREAETQLEGVMAERDHYRLSNARLTAEAHRG